MSSPLDRITDAKRLQELLDKKKQTEGGIKIDEAEMAEFLKQRVQGQDHVVDDVCRLIRFQWAKQFRKRPIASMLFLGPTGTGKTELAKALAEYLFKSDKNMIRLDCSELKDQSAMSRLVGVSIGYQGAGQGGQLTRPLLTNPKRLILFDEIEKAYSGVFDLFLSMMGDGRITEQDSGKVADATQSIIILTSNAEHEAIGKLAQEIENPDERNDAMKKHLRECKAFRPEIIGRFDRIYSFKPLEGIHIAGIAAIKMVGVARQYGIELAQVDPELILEAMERSEKVKEFGIRELERIIEEMLGESLIAAREAGVQKAVLKVLEDGSLCVEPAE